MGFSLVDGIDLAGVSAETLWPMYVAVGGAASPGRLAGQMNGQVPMDDMEHDLIVQALNEWFLDRGMDSFPVAYARAYADSRRMPEDRRFEGHASRQVIASRLIRYQAARARHDTHETCVQSVRLRMAAEQLRAQRPMMAG